MILDFGDREITEIHLHHEGGGSEMDTVERIEEVALSRQDQRFASIPYHLIVRRPVVEGDERAEGHAENPWTVEEGRPLRLAPASIKGRNAGAVAVVVAGHWHDQPLPRWAYERLAEVCAAICRATGLTWSDIYGHGELAATLCPGYSPAVVREMVRVALDAQAAP